MTKKKLGDNDPNLAIKLIKSNYNFSRKVNSGLYYFSNSLEKTINGNEIPEIKNQNDTISLNPQYTPSIKGRKIRVPLNFMSCSKIPIYLPLISLQY